MEKVLIIGGGVSGLSAGIYARMNGFETVICEKNSFAGGNLTGWDRKGYHIDNCIHWLSGTNPSTGTYGIWRDLGALGDTEVLYSDTLYTVEYENERLSLYGDIDRLETEMLRISPCDRKETERFIRAVKTVQYIGGFGGKEHNGKYGPLKAAASLPLLKRYYDLTAGELADRFRHPLLKRFFSSFFTEWFGSLALVFVFADFCGKNGGIPAGGSLAMAKRMIRRYTDLGGVLLTGKKAEKINLRGGIAESVLFSDGSVISADRVIVTADPAGVFGGMLDAKMPHGLKKIYDNNKLKRFSSVQCAFSCDAAELPFSGSFIIGLPEKYRTGLRSRYLIVKEYSYEPSFAPAHKNILQTMVFCGEDEASEFISLRRDEDAYDSRKAHIAESMKEALEERFAELRGKLGVLDVWTPATYHGFTGSEKGSYMSFAFSSKFLPLKQASALTGVRNVFLATQWQRAPGGLPIAAQCGKNAVYEMMKAAGAGNGKSVSVKKRANARSLSEN